MKIHTAKDSLIQFQMYRIQAMEKHIDFLEEECSALYGQLHNPCKCTQETRNQLDYKIMKIDIRSENCLYIELNDYVYYIDDSTNEQIIEKWHTYHKPE